MAKLFIFISLISVIMGLNPTMNNALRNKVLIDFKDAIVPIITKEVKNLKLPDTSGGNAFMSFRAYNIHINVDPINSSQIDLQFVGGSQLKFSGKSLSMKGDAVVQGRFLFISKTADIKIFIKNVGFSTTIALKAVRDRPNVVVENFNLEMSGDNIYIEFSSGFLNKIIEFIVNLLRGFIARKVTSIIQSSVPPAINNNINPILNSLPLDIQITEEVWMKYMFSHAPVIRNGYLLTKIVAYMHPKGDPRPPPGDIRWMPEFDASSYRGVQFFVSDFIVSSALSTAHSLGLLVGGTASKIADRIVSMNCSITDVPVFTFNKAIEAKAKGTCYVSLDNDPRPKFQFTAEAHLILAENITNATIYFKAKKLELTKLEFKAIQPVDISWFKNAMNQVIEVLLQVVNEILGKKGIPLPVVKEMDYSDIMQYVGDGFIMVGTTPKFRFNTSAEEKVLTDQSGETINFDDEVDQYVREHRLIP
eukprot:TRINITY_DN9346_c0_g1_i1.p1 TRINITY_DN9346_c0_g1~~TRINITY_DN9346_c0_g1_i1.p1  ORF type:complete len:476 (-),score=141.91 TRINITY_DN9346_c0_g1_i1:60-1487(-)